MLNERVAEVRRDISKALFGNRYRLEVAVFVARSDDGLVYATQMARDLHELVARPPASNQVAVVLSSFVDAGVMQRLSGGDGRDPAYFQRLDSPFWELVEAVWESTDEAQSESNGARGHLSS